MHPGSIHYGIEPYAPSILANIIARFGLKFGMMPGGVTALGNDQCTLLLSDVEGSVVLKFSMLGDNETTYSPFTFLRAIVPGGLAAYPLNAPDPIQGEERIVAELSLINSLLESGVFDPVLNGSMDWLTKYQAFEAEYLQLNRARFFPPIKGHPQEQTIYEKKCSEDLTWMDDVRRILAEQESQS